MNNSMLAGFTDILEDEIPNSQESQPLSISSENSQLNEPLDKRLEASFHHSIRAQTVTRPAKGTGQYGQFRSVDEIDEKYRGVFSYPFFNLVQSSVIEDALYSDKSMVVCAPTGSGKTVVFEMAIVQLLMELEDKHYKDDFKIIYMAPIKALCTERLTEWYPKFTKLGLMCIAVTGDTDVDFSQLKPYKIIITTPEKWDMVTRRWREHRQLVEVIKLFLIDEVHILNDQTRGPVLEAVVSRMKTIEASAQSAHRIEQLQKQYQTTEAQKPGAFKEDQDPPRIRFVAVSATVSNPGDVAAWLGNVEKPAVYYKFGDESRPVKLKRVVEGYPCPEGTSIFKFDIILNYKLWPVIQKYHNGKPTLIFCNTRKSVALTAETLSRELTVQFSPEQKAKLAALASTIKTKKLQMLILSGVGCHHAGLLYEERNNIENAFRNRDLPILITTTTLAMGVNLPAHLVIIKNTLQYVNGAYQEYSISTVLQMVGRAGRPQYDTEAIAVIMTRLCDKPRYQSLVGGSEPLQSYLHKRLAENLNSEAALGTVNDVAQCVQWLRSTFLCIRAARDPKRYLGLPQAAPQQLISKKIEELCVKAMNGLATNGLITMDEASCIESTEAGRLMSIFYLDLETMKHIMKINGYETLERLLWIICESHELADMHLRVDERRCLNALNRNNAAATIRFPMKGKINSRQMKLNCIIQAILGCLNIPEPSLNQEAMKIMRIADRVCKCLVAYVTRPALITQQPKYYSAVLNALILAKCVYAHLWENSPFVSKQLKGIGPTFSTLLATAGKVNFMLLEESHPRDLERIMNKGPPAGNVLRKQVSLLPKYQLTMTPVDEKSVTVQLVLLNQNHLSENIQHLTAGATHKSYVVIGDSENNLLLLTSFKDSDLISVYNGVITHQITRKHSFEHKMFAHCISSSFVGIDAECEYIFKDLGAVCPTPSVPHLNMNEVIVRKPGTKQTVITETFQQRKRKNNSENDVTQAKEKKKRDNVLLEKFKSPKDYFGKTSKELKEDLDKPAIMSNKILQELTHPEKPTACPNIVRDQANEGSGAASANIYTNYCSVIQDIHTENIDSDELMDDEKINNILIEIENEISEGNTESDLPYVNVDLKRNPLNIQMKKNAKVSYGQHIDLEVKATDMQSAATLSKTNSRHLQSSCTPGPSPTIINTRNFKNYKVLNNMKKNIQKNTKSVTNYNYPNLSNKTTHLSDEEDELGVQNSGGFSDTIKFQIEKYLQETKNISKVSDKSIMELLVASEESISNVESEQTKLRQNSIKDKNEEKTNALTAKDSVDYVDLKEKDSEENTKDERLKDSVEHGMEIHSFQTSQTIIDEMGKKYKNNIQENNPKLSIYTNINPNLSPIKCLSVQKNTENQNDIAYTNLKIPNPVDNAISKKYVNNNKNIIRQIIPFSFYEEKAKIRNAVEFASSTPQIKCSVLYPPLTFAENFPIKRQKIYQNNPVNTRNTDMKKTTQCRLELVPVKISQSEQFTVPSLNYSQNNNNGPKINNQRSNIRKYSYSAATMNVSTREDNVTVIRKLQMDINITEIIAQREKEKDREQDTHICSNKGYTMDMNNMDFKNLETEKFKRYNNVEDKGLKNSLIEFSERRHTENLKKDEPQLSEINLRYWETAPTLENKTQQPYNQQQYAVTNHEEHHTYPKNPKTKYIEFKVESDGKYKENQTLCNINDSNNEVFTKQSKEDNIPLNVMTTLLPNQPINQTQQTVYNLDAKDKHVAEDKSNNNNKIQNILQKYNKILRKDDNGSISQTSSQPPVSKDITSSKILSEKLKQPFKISDIQSVKMPLPKLLLGATCKRQDLEKTIGEQPNTENKADRRYHMEQIKNAIYQQVFPNKNLSLNESPKETGDSSLYCDHNQHIDIADRIEEELSKFNFNNTVNVTEDLEPHQAISINIDQSMFNPKTLLQCFGKDEADMVIVPPPPEFCDDSELACYEPMHLDHDHDNNSTAKSIFQDDSLTELTPRKEIETWSLSQYDESYQNVTTPPSYNSRQCFTTMHTPRKRNSQFQNVSEMRQSKLGQFKFSQKIKLLKP